MYAVLLISAFLQLTVLDYISVLGVKPDIMLVSIVFFGLFFGSSAGLEAGLVSGIIQDIFVLDFFGINMIVLGVTGFVAGAINEKVFKESPLTRTILVLFFVLFSMSMHFIAASFLSRYINLAFSEYFANSIVSASIYTGLISIPILSRLIDMFAVKDMEELL